MFQNLTDLLDSLGVPVWLFGLLLTLITIYLYSTWTFSTFTNLGFPQRKTIPLLGTSTVMYTKGLATADLEDRVNFNRKAYGGYLGRVPVLVLGDLEDIRRLCIKDFSVAPNHWDLRLRGAMKYSLFDSRDERWQNQRQALSPAFSGLKLKQMIPWIQDCADKMTENILTMIEKDGCFEMKEAGGAMTMDVIAATGFGVQADTLNNPTGEFVTNAQKFLSITFKDPAIMIAIFFRFMIPVLEKLNYSMIPKDVTEYFHKIIKNSLQHRKENADMKNRTDILQLMVNRLDKENEGNIRSDYKGKWVEKGMQLEEIYANSLLMLVAGYDTTASSISFLSYNLALNPEVQDRLIIEIDDVLQGAKPDYENVQQLKYLDQCVYESLRLYPPAARTDRQLKKPFEVEGKVLPSGTIIGIPIYAIHHDEEIWPEPEKFNPDRFAEGTKTDDRFLAFGIGPRMCIGNRLALLEVKIAVARLLQSVKLKTCDKTEIPLQLSKEGLLKPANGVYLTGTPRT